MNVLNLFHTKTGEKLNRNQQIYWAEVTVTTGVLTAPVSQHYSVRNVNSEVCIQILKKTEPISETTD